MDGGCCDSSFVFLSLFSTPGHQQDGGGKSGRFSSQGTNAYTNAPSLLFSDAPPPGSRPPAPPHSPPPPLPPQICFSPRKLVALHPFSPKPRGASLKSPISESCGPHPLVVVGRARGAARGGEGIAAGVVRQPRQGKKEELEKRRWGNAEGNVAVGQSSRLADGRVPCAYTRQSIARTHAAGPRARGLKPLARAASPKRRYAREERDPAGGLFAPASSRGGNKGARRALGSITVPRNQLLFDLSSTVNPPLHSESFVRAPLIVERCPSLRPPHAQEKRNLIARRRPQHWRPSQRLAFANVIIICSGGAR